MKNLDSHSQYAASQPLEGSPSLQGKFGRLFPTLPLLQSETHQLKELGQAMKDNDEDLRGSNGKGDNKSIESGYTYFGQFIDHDMSFDPTSLSSKDKGRISNFRTPALDLDSVYGLGPDIQPYLYESSEDLDTLDKFIIGVTKGNKSEDRFPNDLPRVIQAQREPIELSLAKTRYALIPDPRNDSHVIISQLHLAFIKFHNKIIDDLSNDTLSLNDDSPSILSLKSNDNWKFDIARLLTIWHYQWIILHEYLPKIINKKQLKIVLDNFRSNNNIFNSSSLPLEFSAGAFRFAHSMIRPSYILNSKAPGSIKQAWLEELSVFTSKNNKAPLKTSWIIDWHYFFKLRKDIEPNYSRLINPYITHRLFMGEQFENTPLITMDLMRANHVGLPSGQSVADQIGVKPLTSEQIETGSDGKVAKKYGFHENSPLIYYILKEAEIQQQGKCLGDVGSRIVAEVIIGLLESDPCSFLAKEKSWEPYSPTTNQRGTFTMVDFLNYSGVLSKPNF